MLTWCERNGVRDRPTNQPEDASTQVPLSLSEPRDQNDWNSSLASIDHSDHSDPEGLPSKKKRQIFREQVLPALGGKIPEEAFRTDRLALNRLNKEGISVPDGVLLDQRHVHKHPHLFHHMPDVIKVYLTSDGRYTPPEGRFHYNQPKSIDTTYIIRKPFTPASHHQSKGINSYGSFKHSYAKPQGYSNFRQIVPLVPPQKPGVYKPIVVPFFLPSPHLVQQQFDPSWKFAYDWKTIYQPYEEYYVNNIALFDPHQVITDYEGFLHNFHGRHLRHVQSKASNNHETNQKHPQDRKRDKTASTSGFTSLTKVPETNFSCNGRKGLFADVKTKCQVFHDCSGWSKSSSLCPPGTAFSEAKKRCEWWDTVQCN